MRPPSTLTAKNASHELLCQHVFNWVRDYEMPCHVLKRMPDGRLKVLVFGKRDRRGFEERSRVRYVAADRVRPRL